MARLFVGAAGNVSDGGDAEDAIDVGADRFPLPLDRSNFSKSANVANHSAQRRAEATKLFEELLSKTRNEIDDLVRVEREKEAAAIVARLAREEAERFFNKPNAVADFKYYCKMATWFLDEAIALSLGKNPKLVNWETVKGYVRVSPFAQEYEKRRELAERAKGAQQVFYSAHPSTFLSWAKAKMSLPPELTSAALDSGMSLTSWAESYEALRVARSKDAEQWAAFCKAELKKQLDWSKAQLDARDVQHSALSAEIARLQKLLALGEESKAASDKDKPLRDSERQNLQAMAALCAYRGYGFDPARKNSASKNIHEDLAGLGFPYSDDQILKQLQAGFALFAASWREKLKSRPKT